ncbi:MAG TPA: DUF1080 domain-containing protein [Gemmatimonadales bacterium]|nr:DUF1080 domain-containing protein [Gemmatimonadales bacterium]
MKVRYPLAMLIAVATPAAAQNLGPWPQHALDRPQPPVVMPAPADKPGAPPADAVVLFDGTDLSQWENDSGGAPGWKLGPGYVEVAPGAGDIRTKRPFGDCQLHVEWSAPVPPVGESQERGNSGVYLMSRYEIQVLDSYQNKTYPDGQAAALYGQYPPLVNASRPPGDWQTYDIVFHGPRFDASGKLLRPARVIVFHNGVLVQDDVVLSGPTANKRRPPYAAHPDKLPLLLQNHGNPVRYRNVWIRELAEQSP